MRERAQPRLQDVACCVAMARRRAALLDGYYVVNARLRVGRANGTRRLATVASLCCTMRV